MIKRHALYKGQYCIGVERASAMEIEINGSNSEYFAKMAVAFVPPSPWVWTICGGVKRRPQ